MAVKKELTLQKRIMRFIIVNIGLFLVSAGLHFFLVPDNLSSGGSGGLAVVLSSVLTKVPISAILLVINIVFIAVGLIFIGKVFGAYTIYSSFALSFYLRILEIFIPAKSAITDDLFINLFFGVLIQAIGMGLVLNSGASTGGTDVVGMLFKKYTQYSFGAGLLLADGLITLGAIVQYGPKVGLYSMLGIIMNSVVIDKMLYGFNSKFNLTIHSKENEKIKNYILNELKRGCTVYDGRGGYSNNDMQIISTILDRKSYILLKNYIAQIDPKAFIYASEIHEVKGQGFTFD